MLLQERVANILQDAGFTKDVTGPEASPGWRAHQALEGAVAAIVVADADGLRDVENKDLSIDPGMYANTQLQLSHADNVLTVPVEALVLRDNKDVVYALDNQNRVHLRTVLVGLRGSQLAEIKSGLAEGERVILGGQDKYQEGERVTPVVEPRPAKDVTRDAGSTIDLHEDEGGEQ